MKIRNGFVSNSSSSSFIIAVNKPVTCKYCGHTNDLLNQIQLSEYSYNEIVCSNTEEVLKKLIEEREYVKEFDKIVEKITALSIQGKQILEVEVSNHDEELNNLIHSSAVEIIADESDFDW